MSKTWPALPAMRYLPWAIEHMPLAARDLATSGVPVVPVEVLGAVPHISEWGAHGVFHQRIAERYGVPVDEVVGMLGAAGGVAMLVHVLVGPGDEVVVESPAYEPLLSAVEARGGVVRSFDRGPERGWRVTREAVEAVLGPRTRAVLISNPHNPSGVAQTDEELRPLADMLAARGIELIVDEVYRELAEPRTTSRKLGAHVSVTSSLTKCFGLGWACAGWALARPEVVARLQHATLVACGVLPATVGAYGAAGLVHAEALLERSRRAIEVNAARVRSFMSSSRTLCWTEPHPALPFGFVQHVDGHDLSAACEALEARGTLVVPGRFFGVPNGFRMSWMLPAERLESALSELEAVMADGGAAIGQAASAGRAG